MQLFWTGQSHCCEQYSVNVSDRILNIDRATQLQLNVSSNNQVIDEPFTLYCLDRITKEVVPISHTMLRITGEKFNVGMHACTVATHVYTQLMLF